MDKKQKYSIVACLIMFVFVVAIIAGANHAEFSVWQSLWSGIKVVGGILLATTAIYGFLNWFIHRGES